VFCFGDAGYDVLRKSEPVKETLEERDYLHRELCVYYLL